MAPVDWIESFWQSPHAANAASDGNEYNFCGVTLDTVREDSQVNKSVTESRDTTNTRWAAEGRDMCENDDSTVVSTSGVSVLSIDYDNNEIVEMGGEKVDLSDIGDDESTVASFDSRIQNVDEKAEVSAIKETIANSKRVGSNASRTSTGLSRNQSNISTMKIESGHVASNPAHEEKRKELLLTLRNNIATHGRYSVQVATMVTRLAEFHESVDQHSLSVDLNLEALNIYSCKLGDSDPAVTDTQVRLARLKEHLGELDVALDYYCRALHMITAMTGVYEENTSNVRIHVARIYQLKGFHREAVKELKKSLRAYRDIHGDEHVTVADTVDQIADVYTEGGNHDKANSVRGELVKLKVALYGNKSIEVAHALTKWASTFVAIGDGHGALKVMKQAYVMFHEVEGSEAINTESTLQQIGYLYSQSGREEKAIKAHTSVAVMRKIRYGEDSVEVAKSYLILGKSFLKCEQFDKAMKSFNRAMMIFGKVNESNNSHMADLMDALHHNGVVHKMTGKPQHAIKAFNKELSVRRKALPDDKRSIAATLAVVGGTYSNLRKYELSYANYLESLELFDKVEGRRIQFADVLYSCGEVLEKMKDGSATKCYLEAIQIYKANGCGQDDECLKQMLQKIPRVSDINDIGPSLQCTILDNTRNRRSGRVEI